MSRLGFSISSNSEPPFIPALAALICLLLAVVLPISLRWRWRHPFELTLAFAVASVIVPIGNSLPLVALACLIGRRRGPAVWWTTALVGLTTTWVVIWDVTAQPIGASFWKMVFAPTTADSTRSDLTIGAGTAAAIIVTEFVLSVGVGLYVGHHREQQAKAAPLQTPQTAAWPAPPSAPPHTEAAKFTPPEQPHRRPVPATQVTNDWRPSQPPPQANSQADLAARHSERERIAREVHDAMGHRLSLLSLHANALAANAGEDEDLAESARLVQQSASATMDDLRSLLSLLREPADSELPKVPLSQLSEVVRDSFGAGQQVNSSIYIEDAEDADPALTRAVFRIVQEVLTNARKHAAAAPVWLLINGSPQSGISIEARNAITAVGDFSTAGQGLGGIAERARLLGGEAHHGREGNDFVVSVELPWRTSGGHRP